MIKGKEYLDLVEINDILTKLFDQTNFEMDNAVIQEELDNEKIRRIATERITIRRIKNILNQAVSGDKE